MNTRRGVTLIEVLVALSIALLLLLALAGYVRAARTAQVAGHTASESQATLQLALELLREELLLAGSAPWPLPDQSDPVSGLGAGVSASQFLEAGLQIRPGPAGHSLRLVYIDDSLSSQLVARDLTFESGHDAQGQPQLYRRSGSSPRQPWVAGVERLLVAGLIDADGASVSWQLAAGRRVRAVWLELHAMGEVAVALLELPHTPEVAP